MNTKLYDYILVGSGLYSATFANLAKRDGKRCLIVEKRDHIGGNVYCEDVHGITVHKYGAHIFHTNDSRVWDYVNQFAEFNRYTHSPVANYRGEIYNLPFNMNTFAKMWGISSPGTAKKIIEQQRSEVHGEPRNLEEQAISLVGTDIYEKLVKGYTEKQWGRDCKDLPAFIIRRLPVRFTYDNDYFGSMYQGIPIGGYTGMVQRMIDGCDIELGVDYLAHRSKYDAIAKKIVYTGQIDAYFCYCFGKLEYRSLRFETEVLDTDNAIGVAVVNFTDSNPAYTRIIEHKHFDPSQICGKTVITREYPVAWRDGLEPYYTVNDDLNEAIYKRYADFAKACCPNVIFGGRLGEYKYYDMDKVISAAMQRYEQEENNCD